MEERHASPLPSEQLAGIDKRLLVKVKQSIYLQVRTVQRQLEADQLDEVVKLLIGLHEDAIELARLLGESTKN